MKETDKLINETGKQALLISVFGLIFVLIVGSGILYLFFV